MSWSVSAVGRASEVRQAIAKSIANCKCQEPEEGIKNAIGQVIDASLAAMSPTQAVKVEASGSQSKAKYDLPHDPDTNPATNNASLKIEPLWGFLG